MKTACQDVGVARVPISKVSGAATASEIDAISVEEPLEICVTTETGEDRVPATVAVTMRTPGNDEELAVGFLFTEGILRDPRDIESVRNEGRNLVRLDTRPGVRLEKAFLNRQSVVSSSCGACGKLSIAAIHVARPHRIESHRPAVERAMIHALPDIARHAQTDFAMTGGIHASALFDSAGHLLAVREDVGRHNALDKLIGSQLLIGQLPLDDRILVLSGRVSFELVQKTAIAGIPIIVAVGAPSSMAVELARECGITLVGFARNQRFNVYHDAGRLVSTPKALAA
jgi:FdhD protein